MTIQRTLRMLTRLVGALALVGVASSAMATPITYTFTSELPIGTTYGTGSFTFDDSLLIGGTPSVITQANLTSFSYSDPVAGSFTLANVGSLNFTLGTTPITSGFSFTAQSTNGLLSFTGGVVDANNIGGASTSVDFGTGGVAYPFLRFPLVAVPEPSSLAFVGVALVSLAARRVRRARAGVFAASSVAAHA